MSSQKKYILNQVEAEKKLRRMALEIMENNEGEEQVILAGIRENGSVVAQCIKKILDELSSIRTELINIELEKKKPTTVELNNEIDFNNKVVILVDDVANSGKTLMYALKPFLAY